MAGGAPPSSYNWAPTISDNGTSLLELILFLDNILLEVLVDGHNKLTTGDWKNAYPASITNTIGSLTAQSLVHRNTATESLSHYNKPLNGLCQYNFPINSLTDFVDIALVILLLEIGLLLDVTGQISQSDPWMITALGSTLGSKARMTGMINMMQNHLPAVTPREVMIPSDLVYSYAMNHYIVQNSCPTKLGYTVLPPYKLTAANTSNSRLTSVHVAYDSSLQHPQMYVAWVGPWGGIEYSSVASDGTAGVPSDLYGHVFGVLTSANTVTNVNNLMSIAITGPEMIWVTQP